jgi:hypothetical protein
MKTDRGLSARALSFCEHYASNNNAEVAASLAGYKDPRGESSRLLTDARVLARVRAKQDALAKGIELTPEMIVAELERMATTTPSDIVSWSTDSDGNMSMGVKDSLEINDPGQYISSISLEFGKDQKPVTRVKFVDKQIQIQALQLLAKIKGMLIDKVETTGSSQVNVVIDYGLLEPKPLDNNPINSEPGLVEDPSTD